MFGTETTGLSRTVRAVSRVALPAFLAIFAALFLVSPFYAMPQAARAGEHQ